MYGKKFHCQHLLKFYEDNFMIVTSIVLKTQPVGAIYLLQRYSFTMYMLNSL